MKIKKNEQMAGVRFEGAVTFNGPMFDIHDNQQVTIVQERAPSSARLSTDGAQKHELPKELQKAGVRANLDWLRAEGLLDDDYQPVGDRLQVNQWAAVVNRIGDAYCIRNRWSVFERFWGKSKDSLRVSLVQYNPNLAQHREFEEKILSHIR